MSGMGNCGPTRKNLAKIRTYYFFIDLGAFFIKKPSPFRKVNACTLNVVHHELEVLVRPLGVMMEYGNVRIKYRPVMLMNPAREISIFDVHKNPIIKESNMF
jgi:hypothetical protein